MSELSELEDKFINKKLNSVAFNENFNKRIDQIKDKKTLCYGVGIVFDLLTEKNGFKNLNIVAVTDEKFTQEGTYKNFRSIPPENIKEQDFDVILVTSQCYKTVLKYLTDELGISGEIPILPAVDDARPDENRQLHYLETYRFEKTLKKLQKKLKNKKIVLYGAGSYFETINGYFDLSGFNIIAICDKKFENHHEGETFLGYSVCAPNEISTLNPDYVLVSIWSFVGIAGYLTCDLLKDTKIRVKPLVTLPFLKLIREIWNS